MRLRFRWKKILIALLATAIVLWGMKSAAIFGFFKYKRGYDGITVRDSILFPLSRMKIAHDFGEIQIAEAKDLLQKSDFQKALFLLRTGLGRSPENRDARITYANILKSLGEDEITLELYRGGLQYHANDIRYMQEYLQTLFGYRMDGELAKEARERLEKPGETPKDVLRLIAFYLAKEEEANGRFTEALSIIDQYYLKQNIEGVLLLAKMYWHCGDKENALNTLSRFQRQHPNVQADSLFTTLYHYYLEVGRPRDASFIALNYINSAPDAPFAHRLLIESYFRDGKPEKADAEIRNYLRRYSKDINALAILSDYALQSGNAPLAWDTYAYIAENNQPLALSDILLTEANVASGKHEDAIRDCNLVEADKAVWLRKLHSNFSYLRSVIAHKQGQERASAIHRDSILDDDKLEPESMLNLAQRFRNYGMNESALIILEHARKLAPRNEDIVTEIVRIQFEDNLDTNFVKDVNDLLGLRLPDYDLLTQLRPRLASDCFIFDPSRDEVLAKLDATIAMMDKTRGELLRR